MAGHVSGAPNPLGREVTAVEDLPATAAETSAERPWPLRLLSAKMKDYIDRMSAVWIEGQIIELNHRGRASYLTLRDTDVEMSLPVQVWRNVLDACETPLEPGSRVVVQVKADFWAKTGRLSMRAGAIRAVGLGELLARIELLRRQLGQEGLFDPDRKQSLPFLPERIGLITGRNSDAEKDVIRNARLRWPAVEFDVRHTAVQGADAVPQITRALAELDADPAVDVIVIARGGGSLEDLLPFSNETLVRAAAQAATPLVSAIGHENDRPILDEVADLRASTPTDAAKRIVPDMAQEIAGIRQSRAALERAVTLFIDGELRRLAEVRSRPALAAPATQLDERERLVADLRDRSARAASTRLDAGAREIAHLRAQVIALSPQKTLERGYAVVTADDGRILRDADEARPGEGIGVRLARGRLTATITDTGNPDTGEPGTTTTTQEQ
ncbi:exodeoxyribonuclease VII large subunit [Sediminivirga luteola]|uniref:exodeoxyribonuclease VII large subunit n=1 Tax=Sediminivirga luteola TaxID=1774748 RepID=UPI001F566ADC|nr:exodeoxyribonuclease VII large subunit [Sediminivirga luteola]MCI2265649.1 exodeoxyribonuclease VII large subunit [Sediminivirga luteola]